MADKKENSCFECEYYTSAIGEKGYCKFYHHESALPEKACPKYVEKKNKNIKADAPETVDPLSRRITSIILVGAFIASTVLTTLAFLTVLVFIITVFPIKDIPLEFKAFVCVAGVLGVFLFAYILFVLAKKHTAACIIEMLLALIIALVFLINLNETMFFAYHFIVNVIDRIITLFT